MTERMKNIDVALVYELWNEYAAAAQDGDLERWMSLWIEEGTQMAPNAPPRVGKEQIRAAMQSLFDLYNTNKMTIHTEEVRILGDRAYPHDPFKFQMASEEGRVTKSYSGKFLDILKKQVDVSWKVAIDCHNYDSPTE
jgi:uncharacterized protein (TIGR02246 family)